MPCFILSDHLERVPSRRNYAAQPHLGNLSPSGFESPWFWPLNAKQRAWVIIGFHAPTRAALQRFGAKEFRGSSTPVAELTRKSLQ
jgi:hypothetical protein